MFSTPISEPCLRLMGELSLLSLPSVVLLVGGEVGFKVPPCPDASASVGCVNAALTAATAAAAAPTGGL